MRFRDAETERLRLERWGAPEHTAALVELNKDPEVMRFLGGPADEETSEAMSARIASHWEAHGFGLWAAVVKATGRPVGFVGLCHPHWHPAFGSQVEVGWRLARDAWGHGYASEAAAAALQAGWVGGLEEVIAFVDPGNDRSLAVTQRIGMEQVGETVDPRAGEPVFVFSVARPVK
jgi:RimJ/RimL family protein N-acetyltransferase